MTRPLGLILGDNGQDVKSAAVLTVFQNTKVGSVPEVGMWGGDDDYARQRQAENERMARQEDAAREKKERDHRDYHDRMDREAREKRDWERHIERLTETYDSNRNRIKARDPYFTSHCDRGGGGDPTSHRDRGGGSNLAANPIKFIIGPLCALWLVGIVRGASTVTTQVFPFIPLWIGLTVWGLVVIWIWRRFHGRRFFWRVVSTLVVFIAVSVFYALVLEGLGLGRSQGLPGVLRAFARRL